jgi:hypothetical protein
MSVTVTVQSPYGTFQTHPWYAEYNNGGTAIELYNDEGPYATATKWIPGLAEGEVAIKDHCENQGVLNGLVEAGIVAKPHRTYPLPFGRDELQICKLLAEPTNPELE